MGPLALFLCIQSNFWDVEKLAIPMVATTDLYISYVVSGRARQQPASFFEKWCAQYLESCLFPSG